MNNIVEKDSLTFKDIEKEIFKYVCQIAVEITQLERCRLIWWSP